MVAADRAKSLTVRRASLVATLVLGLGSTIFALPGAAQTEVTAVEGRAFGYWATNISLFGGAQSDTGPTPVVELQPDASDSPETATAPSGRVAYGPAILFSSGAITVTTEGSLGPTGAVTSTSNIENINQSESEIFTAERLAGTATASAAGTAGSTTVVGGTVDTHSNYFNCSAPFVTPCGGHLHDPANPAGTVTIPTNPPPGYKVEGHVHLNDNTTDYYVIVFNEQIVDPATGTLTVNPVHEYYGARLNDQGEIVRDPPYDEGGSILQGDLFLGRVVAGVTVQETTTTTTTTTTTVPTTTTTTTTVPTTTTTTTTVPTTTTTTTTVPTTTTTTTTVPTTTTTTTTVPTTTTTTTVPTTTTTTTTTTTVPTTTTTTTTVPTTTTTVPTTTTTVPTTTTTVPTTTTTVPPTTTTTTTVPPTTTTTVPPTTTTTTTVPPTTTTTVVPQQPRCLGQLATIVGGPGNDHIVGTEGDDVIAAGPGNDNVDGLGGDDLICGGEGNDHLRGGEGNDRISGGPGNDTIFGGPGDDRLEGDEGNDALFGDEGDDRCDGGVGNNTVHRCADDGSMRASGGIPGRVVVLLKRLVGFLSFAR